MPTSIKEIVFADPDFSLFITLVGEITKYTSLKILYTDNEIGQRLRFVGVQVSSTVLSNTKERLELIKYNGLY